jgi:hypothetical protein
MKIKKITPVLSQKGGPDTDKSIVEYIKTSGLRHGPFGAPMQKGQKFLVSLQCLVPADPKIVSEDTNKMSMYQQLTDRIRILSQNVKDPQHWSKGLKTHPIFSVQYQY